MNMFYPRANNFERDVGMFGPLSGIFNYLSKIRLGTSSLTLCLLCRELTVSHRENERAVLSQLSTPDFVSEQVRDFGKCP